MTGLDIEAIRHRYAKVEQLRAEESPSTPRIVVVLARAADDVPDLLAEVERLTVEARNAEFEVVRLRGELAEEQTVHAKTMDNFEAMEESALEFRTRQLDRYARLEQDLTYKRAAHRELADKVRALTAERDDALQVIADLRGGTP